MKMGTQFKTMLLSGMAALSSLYCAGQSDVNRMMNKYRVYKDAKPTKSIMSERSNYQYQNQDTYQAEEPKPGLNTNTKKPNNNIVYYTAGFFFETNNVDHAQWITKRNEIGLIFKGKVKNVAIKATGTYDYQYRLRTFDYQSYNRRTAGVQLNRYLRGVTASGGVQANTDPQGKFVLSNYTFINVPAGFGRRLSARGTTLGDEMSLKYQFKLNAKKIKGSGGVRGVIGVSGHAKIGLDRQDRSSPAEPYLLYGGRAFIGLTL